MSPILLAALAAAGCRPADPAHEATDAPAPAPASPVDPQTAPTALARLMPVGGSGAEGSVRLIDLAAGGASPERAAVRVVALVGGLGTGDHYHAIQILAAGSCEDLGESPPHFDPDGAPHGPFDAPAGARHAGDLGNLRSYDGGARYDRLDPLIALSGERSAVGRAVVIRADRDDAWSADGDAGEVLACGVLEAE